MSLASSLPSPAHDWPSSHSSSIHLSLTRHNGFSPHPPTCLVARQPTPASRLYQVRQTSGAQGKRLAMQLCLIMAIIAAFVSTNNFDGYMALCNQAHARCTRGHAAVTVNPSCIHCAIIACDSQIDTRQLTLKPVCPFHHKLPTSRVFPQLHFVC